MRSLIIIISIFLAASLTQCNKAPVHSLIDTLDSTLAASDALQHAKEERIEGLRKKISPAIKDEERLWLNKMLYDEYAVYKADSAMKYVNENIDIARRLGNPQLEDEWQINKVFLLAAQGLLSEAEKELENIDENTLDESVRYAYYETAIYLYSHLSQYIGHSNGMSERYDSISNSLRHKALKHIDPSNPSYGGLLASMLTDPKSPEWASVKDRLKQSLEKSGYNNRTAAINAYNLAKMYLAEGDEKKHTDYLMLSAIADARMCNRDIASLEELANIFYKRGDIDHSYEYINHCLKAALLYPNRVRVVNISSVMDKVQEAAEMRNASQDRKIGKSLIAVSVLSGVLLLVIIFTFLQFIRLKNSHRRLMESKALLNTHMKELHETQQRLSYVNRELTEANEKLLHSNNELLESNYVKEEYVGYVFSICSGYLTKLEEYRKNIARKLKVGKIDDVRALLSSPHIDQEELHEFYHRFDTTFLHIYPRFVEDFNSLLRPEERITPKKGELLNTELRIYALVRLGINDSVNIAEFLHISAQTVYNNRLKTRNKALGSKEDFSARVRQLGKRPSREE